MKIKTVNITDKIFLLIFENQYELTSTFLRFQEFYESPKFKGQIFTLDEYKKWYASLKCSFTYYTDWSGFNIPSFVLQPFYEGKFNPLSLKEKRLIRLFKGVTGDFYIIGISKTTEKLAGVLKHEVAHGLFYTDSMYRDSIISIMSKFDLTSIKKELSSMGGYHDDVLDDEVHAYALEHVSKIKAKIPKELHEKLIRNYQKALVVHNVSFPEKIRLI